jgi:hypothetical protein
MDADLNNQGTKQRSIDFSFQHFIFQLSLLPSAFRPLSFELTCLKTFAAYAARHA